MTGLVRKATLLVVCGLLAATAVFAGVPYPGTSTLPAYINAVGTTGATLGTSGTMAVAVDPSGAITITVLDKASLPCVNSLVALDFTNCTDLKICQDQYDGSKIVACPVISGYTDINGQITFKVVGSGLNVNGGKPFPTPAACCHITADGYDMGYAKVPIYDQDGAAVGGAPGLKLADCRALNVDYGIGLYCGRGDIDHNGQLQLADYRLLNSLYGIGLSATGCGTSPGLCP